MTPTPNPALLLNAVPLEDVPRAAPSALLRLIEGPPPNVARRLHGSAPPVSVVPPPLPARPRTEVMGSPPASVRSLHGAAPPPRVVPGTLSLLLSRPRDGVEPAARRPIETRPPVEVERARRPIAVRPPVEIEHPFPGVRHPVGRPEHGAVAGLVSGIAHGMRMDVPVERALVGDARRDPQRYAADILIYRHDPERYRALKREDRLPSRVWEKWGVRMPERLKFLHREHGAELERRYADRPIAERAILSLAAGTGHLEDVERALDALRRRPDFPRRASFRSLVEGLPAGRVSQIAAGFLNNRQEAIEAYRRVRVEHEREETAKRLRLLRDLLARWGRGGTELVPMFERLSARYSPNQVVAVRRALEARDAAAAAEALFEWIEEENADARRHALEAAFVRFAEEWDASRDGGEQTPMQELGITLGEPVDPIDADPETGFVGRTMFVGDRGRFAPGTTPGLEQPLWGGWGWGHLPYHYGHRFGAGGMPWFGMANVPEYGVDEAGFGGIGGNNTTDDLPPFPHFGGPPRPGRMAADGVYPFRDLTRGMRLEHLAALRDAYEHGHPWPLFLEIQEQRLAEAQRAREHFFTELLEQSGCSPNAVGCSLGPDALTRLETLIADYTPEQKAGMRQAVKGGEIASTLTPREVFRMCEAQNLREHRVDREPLFMRFDGERDRVRLGNPALLALASQAGDVAGPYDGDLLGAASAIGERAFNALGGVEGLKRLGARALGVLRGDPAALAQATPGSKKGEAGQPSGSARSSSFGR